MAKQPRLKYCRGCNTDAEEHRFDGYRQCDMCREKGLTRIRRKVTCSCGRTLLACSLKLHLRSLYHADHTRPPIQVEHTRPPILRQPAVLQQHPVQQQPPVQQQQPAKKTQSVQQESAKREVTQPQLAKRQSPPQATSSAAAAPKLKMPTRQQPTSFKARPVFKTVGVSPEEHVALRCERDLRVDWRRAKCENGQRES